MHRFRRTTRRSREPTAWLRRGITFQTANFGVATAASPFQGNLENVSALDRRLTVLRIKVSLAMQVTVNFAGNTAFAAIWGWGVALLSPGEPTPSPLLITQHDQEADWLFLIQNAVPPNPTQGLLLGTGQKDYLVADIKAKRKVDSDQVVSVISGIAPLGGSFTAGTLQTSAYTSVLYQRTRK